MAQSKNDTSKSLKTNNIIKSVQIVQFACTNCDEEVTEVKLCPCCKAPMRVVEVTEKYGVEADMYLQAMKKKDANQEVKKETLVENGILQTDEEIGALGEVTGMDTTNEDLNVLAEQMNDGIFGTDDDDYGRLAPVEDDALDDWTKNLDDGDEEGDDPKMLVELDEL